MRKSIPRMIIKHEVLIFGALLFFFIPIQWILSWIISVVIHEIGHLVAIRLCKNSIYCIQVNIRGIYILTDSQAPVYEIICSLAGPLLGIIPVIFSKWIPRIAICAYIQTIYNLLPIYPQDGGRIIKSILILIFKKQKGIKVFTVLEIIFKVFIGVLLFYGAMWNIFGSLLPMAFTAYIIKRMILKYSCKQHHERVQ